MNHSTETNRRRILSGVCLALLAILFLTNPLTGVLMRGTAKTPPTIALLGFTAPLQMILFIGAIFGITQLLRKRADRTGLTGAAFALMGVAVGLRILALRQLEAMLEFGVTGVPADTLQKMFTAAPIIWLSIVPSGLMLPIGLIILGSALFITRPINRWIGALLAAGGILFPVGRAVGVLWAISACDLVLGVAFGRIGWQVLTRRELWSEAT
ncbi:MAG TPA: hypothetical protein VEU30_02370 [Thermoanaerobaculia bacterium]|nr:hypothetical protein [Thermoanaerobaculia bacterium]